MYLIQLHCMPQFILKTGKLVLIHIFLIVNKSLLTFHSLFTPFHISLAVMCPNPIFFYQDNKWSTLCCCEDRDISIRSCTVTLN